MVDTSPLSVTTLHPGCCLHNALKLRCNESEFSWTPTCSSQLGKGFYSILNGISFNGLWINIYIYRSWFVVAEFMYTGNDVVSGNWNYKVINTCGLVTPNGDIDLDQHWIRLWLYMYGWNINGRWIFIIFVKILTWFWVSNYLKFVCFKKQLPVKNCLIKYLDLEHWCDKISDYNRHIFTAKIWRWILRIAVFLARVIYSSAGKWILF